MSGSSHPPTHGVVTVWVAHVLLRRRRRRPDDERGAVALLMATMMTLLLVSSAFVLDLGLQRVGRADMQALADVVAMDLARDLDGRSATDLRPVIDAHAARVLARNSSVVGDSARVSVELGEMLADGSFGVVSGGTAVTVLRVTATTDVRFALGGITGVRSGSAVRSAMAMTSSFACYKHGSWAASVKTGNSPLLDPVLRQMAMQSGKFTNGGAVSALSYTGLAAATVDLNQLATKVGVASMQTLATSTVNLKQLYLGLAALAQPSNSTTLNVLNTLAANANTAATVSMGQLLSANAGSTSAAGATANVLDLVGGSIAVLNGANVANVYLGASLPSLTSAGLKLKLVEAPRQYCGGPSTTQGLGPTTSTEQLYAEVGGQLNPTTIDFLPPAITGVLSSIASAKITAQNYATFKLSAAGSQSWLKSITCGNPQGVTLDVENRLATLTFETPLRAQVDAKLLLGTSVRIAIDATVKVVVTVGGTGRQNVSVVIPGQKFDTPYPTRTGGISVAPATIQSGANVSANVLLLGGLLGAWVNLSTGDKQSILDTVINAGLAALFSPDDPHSLSTTVINPLLAFLGAEVGGSDIIVDSTPALNCSAPKLVG